MYKVKSKQIVQNDPYNTTPEVVEDASTAERALEMVRKIKSGPLPYAVTVLDQNWREISLNDLEKLAK